MRPNQVKHSPSSRSRHQPKQDFSVRNPIPKASYLKSYLFQFRIHPWAYITQLSGTRVKKNPKGLTLIEILLVTSIIAIIGTILLLLLNPMIQIKKSWDTKRKFDLDKLRKVIEDWYNDKKCYPKPEEICYDSSPNVLTCHICGSQKTPSAFKKYMDPLICDPEHPKRKYLYQVDDIDCPQSYKIYTLLSNESDPIIDELGCVGNSCGPPPRGFNYGVSSPNTSLETSPVFYCYTPQNSCNTCGVTYQQCVDVAMHGDACVSVDKIYGSYMQCCVKNSAACGRFYWCQTRASSCVQCGSSLDCQHDSRCQKSGGGIVHLFIDKNSCCSGYCLN